MAFYDWNHDGKKDWQELTINKSYQRLNGRDVITTPKTNRTIKGLRIFIISWRSRMKPFIKGSNNLPVWRRRLLEQRGFSRENSATSFKNRRSS